MEAAPVQQTSSNIPVIVARDSAISTGPPGRQQQQQQQQQRHYYEEQPQPKGELVMEKGPVNTMIMVSGGVATLAGGYFGVKFYKKRQQQLVDEFGRMMMFYVGDDKLTNDCVKEYKGKIGPLINGFHKMDMFKSYAMRLAADKPLRFAAPSVRAAPSAQKHAPGAQSLPDPEPSLKPCQPKILNPNP